MSGRKKGVPKYVEAYNQILKLISEGMYAEGSKLPTENELSEELNISRMTLRQSLALLKEDGIIETKQGSGNYVKKAVGRQNAGLEEIGNVIEKVCTEKISDVEYQMTLAPSTEYTQKIFKRKTPVVVEIHRSFCDENKNPVAHSFSMILTDILDEYALDLNHLETIEKFLENSFKMQGHRVHLEMKITQQKQLGKEHSLKSETSYFLLVIEGIYDVKGRLILHNKYYIPIENANIVINWYIK